MKLSKNLQNNEIKNLSSKSKELTSLLEEVSSNSNNEKDGLFQKVVELEEQYRKVVAGIIILINKEKKNYYQLNLVKNPS